MPDVIADFALPRGQLVRLTPFGPAAHFSVMNVGTAGVIVKKGGSDAPEDLGGGFWLPPGTMLPPEDLARLGRDAWAVSLHADGLVAVEAIQL